MMPKRTRLKRGSSKTRPTRMKVVAGTAMTVPQIESLARKIMIADNRIWERKGWRSGGDVDEMIHINELRDELKKMGVNKLHGLFYSIFEDANYHSLNRALEALRVFENEDRDDKSYNEYRKKGGRTWDL